MDDMNAFERQLAARLARKAGPSRPIDALAIAHSAMSGARVGRGSVVTRWSPGSTSWTSAESWFSVASATKLVAAAAIMALFGGLVLLSIQASPETDETVPAAASPSPSPVTVDRMLAGMTVSEDPELGVVYVESDGYRDIYRESGMYAEGDTGDFGLIYREPGMWGEGDIEVGADGSVWIIWPDRFFQLGHEDVFDLDPLVSSEPLSYHDLGAFEAGPDGTLWASAGDDVVSFDSELDEWTPLGTNGATVRVKAIGSDGAVWATTDDGLIRIDAAGSTLHPWPEDKDDINGWGSLEVSDDGVVWLTWEAIGERAMVVRFDGSEWHFHPLPSPELPYGGARVSPDGILWIAGDEELVHHSLARFDGSEWAVFDEGNGVQRWGGKQGYFLAWGSELVFVPQESISALPGGSVIVDGSSGDEWPAECSGMARFDGTTWTELPSPVCVVDADTGPDGSVWVLGPPGPLDDGLRLTVIRPEVSSKD